MDLLSTRLKKLREDKNLMQKEVASYLNITTSAYGFYEQGKRSPTPEILSKLADYFNVSSDYILGRTDIRNYTENEKVDSKKNELLKAKFNKDNLELSKKEIEDLIEKLECLLEKLNDIIDIKNLL